MPTCRLVNNSRKTVYFTSYIHHTWSATGVTVVNFFSVNRKHVTDSGEGPFTGALSRQTGRYHVRPAVLTRKSGFTQSMKNDDLSRHPLGRLSVRSSTGVRPALAEHASHRAVVPRDAPGSLLNGRREYSWDPRAPRRFKKSGAMTSTLTSPRRRMSNGEAFFQGPNAGASGRSRPRGRHTIPSRDALPPSCHLMSSPRGVHRRPGRDAHRRALLAPSPVTEGRERWVRDGRPGDRVLAPSRGDGPRSRPRARAHHRDGHRTAPSRRGGRRVLRTEGRALH